MTASPAMLHRARPVVSAPREIDPESPPPQPKESALSRTVRLIVAIPLFALSVAALFPFAVLPVSTQAVVNARLARVRSPRGGQVQGVSLETGDVVSAHQRLALITGSRAVSRDEVSAALHTVGALEEESSHVRAELVSALLQKSRYDEMYRSYTDHLGQQLQTSVDVAQREQAAAARKAADMQVEVKRDRQALAEHLIPKSLLEQAEDKAERAAQEAEVKNSNLADLKRQLSDARSGYTLSAANQPQFLSQRDEVDAAVARYQQEQASLNLRLTRLGGTVKTDEPQAATLIDSPVTGPIWARSVASGQSVSEGDDLFRVADTASIHVEVWLDRRYGPQLSIGDTALVYLNGLGKELSGKVISFQGTSRRRLDEEVNAIDLQPVHPDQYHVTIELDEKDRKILYMGQAAKVLFPGSKSRLTTRFYFWLTRL
jgi:multidrug efflux pump subunit AcrA (membrane-fusion protein)